MPTCVSSTSTSTRSAGATAVKSSIHTCRYLGAACPTPSPHPPLPPAPVCAPSIASSPAAAGVPRRTPPASAECTQRRASIRARIGLGRMRRRTPAACLSLSLLCPHRLTTQSTAATTLPSVADRTCMPRRRRRRRGAASRRPSR
eukprot:3149541-Pleurochrysis_carterae.AAC.2